MAGHCDFFSTVVDTQITPIAYIGTKRLVYENFKKTLNKIPHYFFNPLTYHDNYTAEEEASKLYSGGPRV